MVGGDYPRHPSVQGDLAGFHRRPCCVQRLMSDLMIASIVVEPVATPRCEEGLRYVVRSVARRSGEHYNLFRLSGYT